MSDPGIIVKGESVPLLQISNFKIPLLPHQAFAADWVVGNGKSLLIQSPTGSGKTLAALASLVRIAEANENATAVFVYPTVELIHNQIASIKKSLVQLGYRPKTFGLRDSLEQRNYNVSIIEGTGEFLHTLAFFDRYGTRRERYQSFGRILAETLDHEAKIKILATTPDSLYLIASAHYGSSARLLTEAAQSRLIVVDEFHAYWGVSLANLLYSLKIIDELGGRGKRLLFLSATPSEKSIAVIEKLFDPLSKINLAELIQKVSTYSQVGLLNISYDVALQLRALSSLRDMQSVSKLVESILCEGRKATDDGIVPCVIILNSVLDAARLAKTLCSMGFNVKQAHGLVPKDLRSIKGDVVVGTSAIELGIDFETNWLLFEGREASSLLQRFGRVGRHFKGNAVAFVPENVLKLQIPSLFQSRNDFEEFVNNSLLHSDNYSEFMQSEYGAELLSAIILSVFDALGSDAKDKQIGKSKEQILKLGNWIESLLGQKSDLTLLLSRHVPKILSQRPSMRGEGVSLTVFIDSLGSALTIELVDCFEKLQDCRILATDEVQQLLENRQLSRETLALLLYAIEVGSPILRANDIAKARILVEVAVNEQSIGVNVSGQRNPVSIFVDGQLFNESQILLNEALFHVTKWYPDWRLNPTRAYESRDNKFVVFGSNSLLSCWLSTN
jgi:CRISPR-associated helicase Cas3